MNISELSLRRPVLAIVMNLIIVLFGGLETWRRWKLRRQGGEQQQAYYRVKPLDRVLVAAVYLSLIALLVVGMHSTHLQRTFS